MMTASHLINRTPTEVLKGCYPYEILYGIKPQYKHLVSLEVCVTHILGLVTETSLDRGVDVVSSLVIRLVRKAGRFMTWIRRNSLSAVMLSFTRMSFQWLLLYFRHSLLP